MAAAHMPWPPATNPEVSPCPNPLPRLGLVRPRGMAGSLWPDYALPGDAVYRLALVVANNGLSPNTGPIEVYRWCQPSLEVGGNKR